MDPELMHDLTPAYALDALDDDERREYEKHLRRCAQCREELAGLRDTAASLAYVAPAAEPSPALRERLLDGLGEQLLADVIPLRRRRPVQILAAATAVAAAAAIALAVWAGSLSSSLDSERVVAGERAAALEVLSSADAVRVPLDGETGTLVVSADGRGVLVLPSIGAAPSGQRYAAWVIRDGAALLAGLFPGGEATVVRLTESVPAGSIVAVTVEDAAGVDQPTSDPIFSASLV